jgi:hypothetical protein
MTDEQRNICLKLLSLFTIDGKKASEVATDGQIEIFFEIVFRVHSRVEILTSTQYGKSLFVALASIIVTCIQKETMSVVAPTNEKAKIIMRYFIDHLGDNILFYSQLEKDSKLDRLRMEESKERIKLKNGGGIFVVSVQAGNSKKGIESAMGAGCIVEGYKITTSLGELDIKDVVDKKIDCEILSFNHKTNKQEFKKIVSYQKNPIKDRYILEIDIGDKKFRCTNDHPIWVEGRGYVRADELGCGLQIKIQDDIIEE